ncbi:MAG: peptidyl-alpha-hydroxyglycine alpha-amidating lyase family protein [Thermoguttaceae bacterium]
MHSRSSRLQRPLAIVVTAAALATALHGSLLESATPQKTYPRVNLATVYEVDPKWPQKPENVSWGEMPGVAVDKADRVWVFTRANPPVQVYDAGGKLIRAWGEGSIRTAHFLRFDPQGNVWVADVGNHVVLQFTVEGKLLKTLGTPGDPGCDRTHLDRPTDMAITPGGDVFVADGYGNDRIVHFDRDGKFVKQWGKLGTAPGEFSLPHSIVRDSAGRLYVADRNNVRIQVFDETGKLLDEWRNLLVPWGLCITAHDEIWACGSSPMPWIGAQTHLSCPPKDQVVMKFDTSGKVLSLWTFPKGKDGKEQPGEVNWLHGIALDAHGNLYAGDIMGRRIQKFVKTCPQQ